MARPPLTPGPLPACGERAVGPGEGAVTLQALQKPSPLPLSHKWEIGQDDDANR